MHCRFTPGLVGFLCGAILVAGCATMPSLLTPVASYGPSTIVSPEGYEQTKIDDTHFEVRAKGTDQTPRARVEKIARARAAQIGVETKQKYFKVAGVQHTVDCKKRRPAYKSEATVPWSRPQVKLDVVYSETRADPEFTDAEAAFAQLQAELNAETITPEARAAAEQEVRASCGGSTGA
jgi:hypothetical protein